MKHHLCLYGDDSDLRDHDLTGIDWVITEWYAPGLAQAKAEYPDCTFLMYRPLCGIHGEGSYGSGWGYDDYPDILANHPDWFAYDEIAGTRVMHKHGWYLMDLTRKGFRDHLAGYIMAKLATYPEFSGVFLDCAFDALNPVLYVREGTKDQANISDYAQMFPAASRLTIQGINCFKICLPEAHVAYCDGTMIEGFVHAAWNPDSLICGPDRWAQDVGRLKAMVAAGKIVLLQPGGPGGPNDEVHRKMSESGGILYGNANTSYCYNLPT